MKKLQSLGRSLSKNEQKNIIGGDVDPGCSCKGSGDRVAHCCEGSGACHDEAWGSCNGVTCEGSSYCREYCVHSDNSTCWM